MFLDNTILIANFNRQNWCGRIPLSLYIYMLDDIEISRSLGQPIVEANHGLPYSIATYTYIIRMWAYLFYGTDRTDRGQNTISLNGTDKI